MSKKNAVKNVFSVLGYDDDQNPETLAKLTCSNRAKKRALRAQQQRQTTGAPESGDAKPSSAGVFQQHALDDASARHVQVQSARTDNHIKHPEDLWWNYTESPNQQCGASNHVGSSMLNETSSYASSEVVLLSGGQHQGSARSSGSRPTLAEQLRSSMPQPHTPHTQHPAPEPPQEPVEAFPPLPAAAKPQPGFTPPPRPRRPAGGGPGHRTLGGHHHKGVKILHRSGVHNRHCTAGTGQAGDPSSTSIEGRHTHGFENLSLLHDPLAGDGRSFLDARDVEADKRLAQAALEADEARGQGSAGGAGEIRRIGAATKGNLAEEAEEDESPAFDTKTSVRAWRVQLDSMARNGWQPARQQGKHRKFTRELPDGSKQTVTCCCTPSDSLRGIQNLQAVLSRMDRQAQERCAAVRAHVAECTRS